jgi:hypothetical protein
LSDFEYEYLGGGEERIADEMWDSDEIQNSKIRIQPVRIGSPSYFSSYPMSLCIMQSRGNIFEFTPQLWIGSTF